MTAKRYDPDFERKRGPYAQVRSFVVRGKKGYYRRAFTMRRRGKRVAVKRTYVPPSRKTWRVKAHKKKVWYLPGQV